MKPFAKHRIPALALLAVACLFMACLLVACDDLIELPSSEADPADTTVQATNDPLPEADIPEKATEELPEEVTNFPVVIDSQKSNQRTYHTDRQKFYVRPWDLVGTADECPHTVEDVLAAVELGDDVLSVYEEIGYPTRRDYSGMFLSGRPHDFYYMTYDTADGDSVELLLALAGCIEKDYRYLVTDIYVVDGDRWSDHRHMDFDTKVRLQIIPIFMAVEQVGVDYLLEKELITPYEATLYPEEEAVFQSTMQNAETDTAA